jgi:hypothetical protein
MEVCPSRSIPPKPRIRRSQADPLNKRERSSETSPLFFSILSHSFQKCKKKRRGTKKEKKKREKGEPFLLFLFTFAFFHATIK